MLKETVTVNVNEAQDVRPVAMLVQQASRFSSSVYIEKAAKSFNAKSIMGMMTLGLMPGDELTISAQGEDEADAIQAVAGFLTGKTV